MKKIRKSLNQWLETLETQHSKKIDLGLERIREVFSRLNIAFPENSLITVAGTNGKGSTVSIISSIAQAAGLSTGEFTSPHILCFNERIKINGKLTSDEDIVEAFEQIDFVRENITLSYFEYSTLAAFLVFQKYQVDVVILEVGLGGRLDSTNVIDTDCAVITTIDIDHTEWLGDSKEEIGFEKAGIARNSKPLVIGSRDCPESIIRHAKDISAVRVHNGEDYIFEVRGDCLNYEYKSWSFENLPLPNIQGDWQCENAATAITALLCLKSELITQEHIERGLKSVQLPGRLQIINETPEIILDVSHNSQAAQKLASWLKANPIEGKTFAVFAVLNDKNLGSWVHEFKNEIDIWCVSDLDTERSMNRKALITELADVSQLIMSFESVSQAFNQAIKIANDEDRILVFGSFYTVSEAYQLFLDTKT